MRFESGRHRTAENFIRTKHVVAAGLFVRDAGSTPAASTTFYRESRRNHYETGRSTKTTSDGLDRGGPQAGGDSKAAGRLAGVAADLHGRALSGG